MEEVVNNSNGKVKVLDWASFECYLMTTPICGTTPSYADFEYNYENLEQYASTYLKDHFRYTKNKLSPCFTRKKCFCEWNNGCGYNNNRDKTQALLQNPLNTINLNDTKNMDSF